MAGSQHFRSCLQSVPSPLCPCVGHGTILRHVLQSPRGPQHGWALVSHCINLLSDAPSVVFLLLPVTLTLLLEVAEVTSLMTILLAQDSLFHALPLPNPA